MAHNKYLPELVGVELGTKLNVQPTEPDTAAPWLPAFFFFFCLFVLFFPKSWGKRLSRPSRAGLGWAGLAMDKISSAPS